MHPNNYNHNSHCKGDHNISIYFSFNTYYTALMLRRRRIKKIPSESLLFSHYAAELWNSMLSMLKACVTEEQLDTFKGDSYAQQI